MPRKDFPRWIVEEVYRAQEGICGKIGCNKPLDRGFHRHHKDGNPENNSAENCELWCPECHYATFTGKKKDDYEAHKKQEREALANINKLIGLALEGKTSGVTIERLKEAIGMSLRISRRIAGLDAELEKVPPSIAMAMRMQEMTILQDTYMEGFKEGVQKVILTVEKEKA